MMTVKRATVNTARSLAHIVGRATLADTAEREGPPMQRHREPLAAILAALAVFVGIVAPVLMLAVAATLAGAGIAALVMSAATTDRTDDRRRVQNPH
jgi:hypothetical protein